MPLALLACVATLALAYGLATQAARAWHGRGAAGPAGRALLWLALAEASVAFTFALAGAAVLGVGPVATPEWDAGLDTQVLGMAAGFGAAMLLTLGLLRLLGPAPLRGGVSAPEGAGLALAGGRDGAEEAQAGLDLTRGEATGVAVVAALSVMLVAGILLVGGLATYGVLRLHLPRTVRAGSGQVAGRGLA